MKISLYVILFIIICNLISFKEAVGQDLNQLVEFSKSTMHGEEYFMLSMNRKNERIKAKYFASEDINGESVHERFLKWGLGRKIIAVSSGTYMNGCYGGANPVGLTIDNGVPVNVRMENFDGLVIVYATGGVVASNLQEKNLSMYCDGENKVFDITDSWDRQDFINCAKSVDATVFQTHLLVWKNELKIYSNSSSEERERRFLAVCKDEEGHILHVIVHYPNSVSLLKGAKNVKTFLTEFKDMEEVVFLVNLDTGCQDIFFVWDNQGNIRETITGRSAITAAANLLVYYYE